jgi:DNA mismatch endonuclease, patch repair protein
MADVHTPEQRSFNMSRIRGRDTKPEIIVRSIVHGLGYRYRLHCKSLPGKPDLVLRRHQKIILIHGCFWHMHHCHYGRVVPKTNADFWSNKRCGNKDRDKVIIKELRKAGFQVLTIWECQTRKPENLKRVLNRFLKSEYH